MPSPITDTHSNRADQFAAEMQLLEVIDALLPDETLLINGEQMTKAEFKAIVQDHLDAATAADKVRQAAREAAAVEKAKRIRLKHAYTGLKAYVTAHYGEDSETFGKLGLPRRKTPVVSVEVRKAAVAKRLATRKLRNTLGKRQREKIKAAAP